MMKCSNCGSPIDEGQLFCDKCGQEVQWVPDYDTFGSYIEQERRKKEQQEKEEEAAKEKERAVLLAKKKKRKKKTIIAMIILIIVLLAVAGTIIMKIRTESRNYNDFSYQMKMADISYSNQKYEESYNYIRRAVELDGTSVDARLLQAQILVSMDKADQAVSILQTIIEDHPDQCSVAYGQLIKIYMAKEEPDKIKELMDHCDDPQIRQKYSNYISNPPVFRIESGTYEEEKQLELYSKGENEKIYYTTDGTIPTEDSTLYKEAIILGEGTTTVNAITINDKGISSDVVTNQYVITLPLPDAPRISPSSGTFTTDMDTSIYVIIPKGCKAYYAFDEKPTKNSKEYIPGQPVEMPKGTHTFYAVLENERGQLGYPGSAIYTLNDPE